jgi:hypothetical protein
MLDDLLLETAEFAAAEAARDSQGYGFEPELGESPRLFDVHVRRFVPFVAVEEEPR